MGGSLRAARSRRSATAILAVASCAAGLVVGTVAAATPASAAVSSYAHLTRGVSLWRDRFWAGGRIARAVWLSADLANHNLSLNAATAGNALNARYETVSTMARRGRAVGGVNADWFEWGNGTGSPRGGAVRDGRIYKTPQRNFDANLWVGPHGYAHIGRVQFAGRVTHGRNVSHGIYSVNTVQDALNGAITLVTPTLRTARVRHSCMVVRGWWAPGARVVTSVRHEWSFARLRPNHWALVGCGSSGSWLLHNIHVHNNLAVSVGFANGPLRTLVSGGRVLINKGHRYYDAGGEVLGAGGNPETFACVSRTGRFVNLGVVDGRSGLSAGVSYGQLTQYLLWRGCYSAMVFDGGGSTTLVARSSHERYASVRNRTSDWGGPRHVADGVFIYATR